MLDYKVFVLGNKKLVLTPCIYYDILFITYFIYPPPPQASAQAIRPFVLVL